MSSPLLNAENSQLDTVHKAIIFDNVCIEFEGPPLLDGVSFELKRGETKTLMGVAGSGKSTILKLCLGLLKPDSGHIYVLGHDVTAMTERELFELRNKVGIVFQESALFDSLTVRDNVAFRLMEEKLPEKRSKPVSARPSASWNWSTPWTCCPPSFPGVCGEGSASRAPLSPSPRYCSMTHPPADSIPLPPPPSSNDHEAARRVQDQRPAGEPSPAGWIHAGQSLL